MNAKLQELTDKIYLEGVEKGNNEAAIIIERATAEAMHIKAQAQAQAQEMIAEAEAKSAEIAKNTHAELKLFARQSVNALKTEITNIICGKITSESVKAATADKAFMHQAILKLVEEWSKNQQVIIEAKDEQALTAYFMSNAKALLNKGVKITQANHVKTDFTIIPEKDGYKINIGEDEFIAYFKEFLRPKLVEMLF